VFYIPIIAASTRRDRQSIKVARFVLARLQQWPDVQTELLDLLEYNFPIMEERLHRRDDPPPRLQEFGDTIRRADSLIVVTPEYNNGYPGVLKNALDYLLPEYERKPIGIVTVSAGGFGGINCLAQLRLVTLGMGAFPIPASLPVSRVRDSFNEDGTPNDAAFALRATARRRREGLRESSPVRSAGLTFLKSYPSRTRTGRSTNGGNRRAARARPKADRFYRPSRSRDGAVFCFISQHFVLGYFRQVPAGLIFSNHQRTCTIQIANP
jgi:NAD(P)H-dependent FMN reductase